jgi:DNA repair protein RecO (recombination protein O)
VLKSRDYGEADKLLTVFTRARGKVQAIVKGVRKPKSRLRGGVQLLTLSDFQLYEGRGLDTVTQVEVRDPFYPLMQDLTRMTCAGYMVELAEGMLPEREKNEPVFSLLLSSWRLLGAEVAPELTAMMFGLRMMVLGGYRPETTTCVHCHEATDARHKFSYQMGGLLCYRCWEIDTSAMAVSPASLAVMRQLLHMPLAYLPRLKVTALVSCQLDEILNNYIKYRLERNLRSREFLLEIKRLTPKTK